jgi:HK97 family phage major capsid protein
METAVLEQIQTTLAELKAGHANLANEIKGLSQPAGGTPANPASVPSIRRGENVMSSRGYSFTKAAGFVRHQIDGASCRVETDMHNRLQKALVECGQYVKGDSNSFLVPFSTQHLCLEDQNLVREVHEIVAAGAAGADPQEVAALKQRYWGREKALSWIDHTSGGALVSPPVMGELIELFRNNEALLRAGARELPMPPQGRLVWPRQTDATTAYWVGENNTITSSEFATGDLVMIAKKLGLLVKLPNELFRFSSVSMEQFVREDMMKSAAIKFDKTALEGVGSTYSPKGIINYANITGHTASTTGSDGDTFEAEDVALMIGKTEEQNAEFTGWIMRPLMYSALRNRRADAVSAADGAGAFLFDRDRSIEDPMNRGRGAANLEGYPVVKSTNVANDRIKGNGDDLTYILGGNFRDVLLCMSGVLEFLVSDKGDTMVTNDQTWVRGTLFCDVGVRHEASLVLCDQLVVA